MEVYDLVLSAKSYSKFYETHLKMAREKQSINQWITHVKLKLLPEYRVVGSEPYEGMTFAEIAEVAQELKYYYEEHVKEME